MSTFLSLPYSIRERIYFEFLLTRAIHPQKLNEQQPLASQHPVAIKPLDERCSLRNTLKVPMPSSLNFQLCCKQMQDEISYIMKYESFKAQMSTFSLSLSVDNKCSHINWIHVPTPLGHLRSLHFNCILPSWSSTNEHGNPTLYYELIRILAALIRRGRSPHDTPNIKYHPRFKELAITFTEGSSSSSSDREDCGGYPLELMNALFELAEMGPLELPVTLKSARDDARSLFRTSKPLDVYNSAKCLVGFGLPDRWQITTNSASLVFDQGEKGSAVDGLKIECKWLKKRLDWNWEKKEGVGKMGEMQKRLTAGITELRKRPNNNALRRAAKSFG